MTDTAALEAFFVRELTYTDRAMTAHLPRLRALADGLDRAVELGVGVGGSSSALLLGARQVLSIDIAETLEAAELRTIAGDRWEYRIVDSLTTTIGPCDLLFVDSLHTFDHVDAELRAHADAVRRYLVFHDSITFGSVGADGGTGQPDPTKLGIRPAIDLLMIRDPRWRIAAHYLDSHGLLVLEAEGPHVA